MSKFTTIAASLAVLPALAFAAPVMADNPIGQVEEGNFYRARNVTTSETGAFGDNANAVCGDTVQFRVRIHNLGPSDITNVVVAATLDSNSGTTHGSTATITADNNLHGSKPADNAGVTTDSATTISYVSGSTQLLDYSSTPGGEHVLKNLPDGITSNGVNIGTVGPVTSDTEEVQFKAKLNCVTTPPAVKIQVCELSTKNVITIKETDFDSAKHSKDLSKCKVTVTSTSTPTTPTELVKTGPANVAAIFAVVAVAATAAYSWVLRRQNAR